MIKKHEREYIVWQNRAVDFYVAARSLYLQGLSGPAAYCAISAIELLLKATLVYFDRSFVPADARHNVKKMLRMLKNKGPKNTAVSIPEYFFFEQRYQSVSRYPADYKRRLGLLSFKNKQMTILRNHLRPWMRSK